MQTVLVDELTTVISHKMKYEDPRLFFWVIHSWVLLHPELHVNGAGTVGTKGVTSQAEHGVRLSPLVFLACNGMQKVVVSRLTVPPKDALAGLDAFSMSPVLGRVYPILKSKITFYAMDVLRKTNDECFSELYNELHNYPACWTKEAFKTLQRIADERGFSG